MWKAGPITAFIIIACLLTSMRAHAQKVSLSYRKASLKTIITDIEKQTNFRFFYDKNMLRYAQKIDIQVTNVPLQDALDICFKEQPLNYVIVEQTISIRLKPGATPAAPIQSREYTKGLVTNEKGVVVPGATISLVKGRQQIATNDNGAFTLVDVEPDDTIVVSSVNYEPQMIPIEGKRILNIFLKDKVGELSEVAVVSTGYQDVDKGRMTGSAAKIDNKLLNRGVSTNIINRLEGVTPGLAFNKNIPDGVNQSQISIRGRSTIYASANPLIILDNFPYNGSLSSINPNDVESITVLKDAAATAIWGALAGNGVIVINTKKGRYSQAPKVSINTNVTIGENPDTRYVPYLPSADYVEAEKLFFDLQYYKAKERSANRIALTPVVEILIKKRDGLISTEDADAQLEQLKQQDLRSDMEKYLLRKSVNQQHSFSIAGGGVHNHYYFSAGYDKNIQSNVGAANDRLTLNAQNTFALLNRKFELLTGIIFTTGKNNRNTNTYASLSQPYLSLADEQGNPMVVPLDIRQPYKDTAGGGKLLDWNYRPLEEVGLTDDETKVSDYRINAGLKYKLMKGFEANVLYQYNRSSADRDNYKSQEAYFTRNLINTYTQINGGIVDRKMPLGGILDKENYILDAHNIRAQLNFNRKWNDEHQLNAMAGWELRTAKEQFEADRLYGYDRERQTSAVVDYQTSFPKYYNPSATSKIPYEAKKRKTTGNYISYFTNILYTWKEKYSLSASARKDESNIFGVNTNRKGVPLWSAGFAWQINKEKFYKLDWLPYLKLRVTHGYSGNVDKAVSALTTARAIGLNYYGAEFAYIENPPNPDLRWEKVQMINVGIDFASKNNRISGSLDYYIRKSRDLIALSPIDPTTGVTSFKGNSGQISGRGAEVSLNTKNINRKFRWETNLLFNYSYDKVSKFELEKTNIGAFYNAYLLNPNPGRPLYSLYSVKSAGLEPTTGDLQGILDNKPTTNYSAIINSTNLNDLQYHGTVNPIFFGNVMNTFAWKQLELSVNIVWKAGYYFRRRSIHYYDFINLGFPFPGHPDWTKRWQKPGDERFTTVPSMKYSDPGRDDFYAFSDILVEKGDHIRLQDVQLSYSLNRQQIKKLPMQSLRLYVYLNNLGLLWTANRYDIDPDYSFSSQVPPPRTYSIGAKIDF